MQMAGKEDIKPGLEKPGLEESGSSRIRITLTSQEVKPLEKGMCQIRLLWYYSQTSGHLSVTLVTRYIWRRIYRYIWYITPMYRYTEYFEGGESRLCALRAKVKRC
jgi:hypothetical protein